MVVCGLLAIIKQLNHVEIHCMIIFLCSFKGCFFSFLEYRIRDSDLLNREQVPDLPDTGVPD